jgi:cysteinyl-tRNA synthetase
MCWRYLGPEFDIHGGGVDLVFPHHENEITQSRAAGLSFARFWVHHGLLNLGGSKMAKSVGNVIDLPSIEAQGIRAVELRYYLAAPHYRSTIDYSDEALREAAAAYRRLEGFVQRAAELVGPSPARKAPAPRAAFVKAMDDDLNTSKALAVVHDLVREGNAALASADKAAVSRILPAVRAMLDVLGLDPLSSQWGDSGSTGELRGVVDSLVALALEQRAAARTRKDWAAADAVRDQLKAAGIVVEDTPTGPRWTVETTGGA